MANGVNGTNLESIGAHFNRLTPAEDERLAFLIEECSEVIQAAAKIQRHGYGSNNQGRMSHTNQQLLEFELGDLAAALRMLLNAGDVAEPGIALACERKIASVQQWMHHQPAEVYASV